MANPKLNDLVDTLNKVVNEGRSWGAESVIYIDIKDDRQNLTITTFKNGFFSHSSHVKVSSQDLQVDTTKNYVVISINSEDLNSIVNGSQKLVDLFMNGSIYIDGDMGLVMSFSALFE
tara:strand:- start:167 stop:520 length:354 start_codon:yes stop_codon:yes gene_type:complete